jgi:hypothetical protein
MQPIAEGFLRDQEDQDVYEIITDHDDIHTLTKCIKA